MSVNFAERPRVCTVASMRTTHIVSIEASYDAIQLDIPLESARLRASRKRVSEVSTFLRASWTAFVGIRPCIECAALD